MINFGQVPAGAVLPIFFSSYAGATGASVTMTGIAVTDIEIFKGTSMTQRSSDAGYALIDTDGIDIDTITGIHGISVDTGDNTDAGFYAAGSFYTVVVSAVTIDSQTVNFIAATFGIRAAENTAGVPVVDTVRVSGTTQTARDIGASVLLSNGTGAGQVKLASGYVAMTWADVGAPTTAVDLSGTTIAITQKVDVNTIKTQTVTCAAGVTVLASVGTAATDTAQTGDNYAITNSGAHGNAALKTLIDAVDNFVDTEIATIITDVAAVKADTAAILDDTGTTGVPIATGGIGTAAFAAGAINAAAIAADAIGASELAADAANEIADALLARNVAGGSSAGRLVKEALYALRNKCAIAAGTLTVYQVDDTTTGWTAAVTTAAGNPVSEIDPA